METSSVDTDALRRYVALTRRKRTIKAEEKEINQQLEKLEQQLLAQFEHSGLDATRLDGHTVYLQRQIFANARDGDQQRAVEALHAVGLDDYVRERFNPQQISAYVREQEELGNELPDPLKDALTIHEKFTLRVRKAG